VGPSSLDLKRKRELVASLFVLDSTAVLRVPDAVTQVARTPERMHALLRAEMDRLSADPRHFRLLLDYWTIGVRNATIRQKVRAALEHYRDDFRDLAEAIVSGGLQPPRRRASQPGDGAAKTAAGVAAVAVSLIHGCALQSVIDPKGFNVQQHFDVAAQMLGQLAND
jgi:TetR/AcrR family transcriptional regulator, transcriptional repressor of bet genes